jgi:integrase/recombinase XerD
MGGGKEIPVEMLENTELMQGIFVKSLGDVNKQTINYYLRSYRVFGNFCFEKGYLLDFKCPIKEVEPEAKEVYTDKEIEKLTAKPNRSNFLEFRNYMIILTLLATGARSETIRNIKVKDVDLDEGYITFNKMKSKKVIRLGLEKRLHRELRLYIAKLKDIERINAIDIEYLFCNQYGEQLKRNGLYRAISTYNKSKGIKKTSLHLFRHTYAKGWITSSGAIVTLAKVLNHRGLEMVQRYANLYATDVKDEIEEHSLLSNIERKSGKTIR